MLIIRKIYIDKKLTYSEVQKQTELSSYTMSKLRLDVVNMTALLKTASILNCGISDVSSGTRLKLGNDRSQYRIYVAKKSYPNTVIGDGDDFINVGKCVSWGINCSSNCYIA